MTYPNTPVTLRIGHKAVLTWSHNLGPSSTFDLAVSRDGGLTWSTIAQNVAATGAATGSYIWTVSAPRAARALLRVTAVNPVAVSDVGDATFVIKN